MNNPEKEQNAAQRELNYIDTELPSHHCGADKDRPVLPGPAGTPIWASPPSGVSVPGGVSHPAQPSTQTGVVDPLSVRFLCPHQSTPCQLTYPDYFLEPPLSQSHLLTGLWPSSPVSSHRSSVSAPWFPNEPIFCSMIPGDLGTPAASIYTPQVLDQREFQEGLPDFTSHLTQPMVCGMSGDGQVVLVNPSEPEPVFLSLKSAPQQGDDGQALGKGVTVLDTAKQLPQHHQAACPLYESRDQTAIMQPHAPPAQSVGTFCESVSRKPCHCSRSQCLKLYCKCFANGVMCDNCDCSNCHNNVEHKVKRHKAIKSCLGRNSGAFKSKIAAGKSGEGKGWHNKGCNCKRSGCLKNYCECFEANILCTSSCKCVGCTNYDENRQTGVKDKTAEVKKGPVSVVTSDVVEAVCGSLMVQAEEAEREGRSAVEAERIILEKFGQYLSQIVKAMFE